MLSCVVVAVSALLLVASCSPSEPAAQPALTATPWPTLPSPSTPPYIPDGFENLPVPTQIQKTTAVCPEDRENAGLRYQYDPDQATGQQAIPIYCGKPATPPAEHRLLTAWMAERDPDGIDRLYTDTILHDYDGLAENPRLAIWCDGDALMASISVGEGRVVPTPAKRPLVEMIYRFGDWNEPELTGPSFWRHWVGDNDSGAYTVLEEMPNAVVDFVWALRRYRQVSFSVESTSGTNTLHFDLFGANWDVGPVLRECSR